MKKLCDCYQGNADGCVDCEYERGHDGPHSFDSPRRASVKAVWPSEAFENILRVSGLELTSAQIRGVSILVGEFAEKFGRAVADEAMR